MGQYETGSEKFRSGTDSLRWRLSLRKGALLSLTVILFLLWEVKGSWPGPAASERSVSPPRELENGHRNRLLRDELRILKNVAAAAVSGEQWKSGSALERLITRGTAQERSIRILRGDIAVAVAGTQRLLPASDSAGFELANTALAWSIRYRRDVGDLRVEVTSLLVGVRHLPQSHPSLLERAGLTLNNGWSQHGFATEWLGNDAEAALPRIQAALDSIASMIPGPVRERMPNWYALAFGLLLLPLIWLVTEAGRSLRWLGIGIPTAALLLLGSWISGLGLAAVVTFILGFSATFQLIRHENRRREPVWRWTSPIGLLLLMSLPILTRLLADRIIPALAAAPLLIWLGWEIALTLPVAALVLSALALISWRPEEKSAWAVFALIPSGMVLVGAEVWRPAGWPGWFLPLLCLAMLGLLLLWGSRVRLWGVALTASVLALLFTWTTSLERRMERASADVARLNAPVDSLTVRALDDFVLTAQAAHATTLDVLYAAWSNSLVADKPVPTHLALNDGRGTWHGSVALDSIEIEWDDLAVLVGEAGRNPYRQALRRDGIEYQVLVIPFDHDTVATVTIGPRSRLLAPTRFGRLVGWRKGLSRDYRITPTSTRTPSAFDRRGRFVSARIPIGGPDDPLAAQVVIEISRLQPFLVRGGLALLLNLALLIGFRRLIRRENGSPAAEGLLRPSYRRMMTISLAAFFLVPAVVLTAWSVLRLQRETEIRQAEEVEAKLHRPEIFTGLRLASDPSPGQADLEGIAFRIDAELGVYRGDRLIASSTPLLAALGILPAAVAPPAPEASGSEVALSGGIRVISPVPGQAVRMGLEGAGDALSSQLAAVIPGEDSQLTADRNELLLLLLLVTLAGGIAAVQVAGWVARVLSRPIDQLRQAAVATGRGEIVPGFRERKLPAEFVPVFQAMQQMQEDLRFTEAERTSAVEQAAKVTAWGEMARQVAHEIKNALTPMRLWTQHLGRLNQDGDPELPRHVGETSAGLLLEIDRLDRIARAFARYGAPPESGSPLEAVALLPLLRELSGLYTPPESQCRIRFTGQDDMIVHLRRDELIQVIRNLVDNALVAGATQLELRVRHDVLEVLDNGMGIPPEQLDRIFDPSFSTTTSGTGLGLPIVRRLVQGWGGEVVVRPNEPGGTIVTLSFHNGEND